MSTIGTAEQHAKAAALGRDVIALVEQSIGGMVAQNLSEEDRSDVIGRALVAALLLAGEDVEWFNRVYLIQGLGFGIGSVVGQWPESKRGLLRRLDAGVRAGERTMRLALSPAGRA